MTSTGPLVGRITILGPPPTKKNRPVVAVSGLQDTSGKKYKVKAFLEMLMALAKANKKGTIISILALAIDQVVIRVRPNDEYRAAERWALPQISATWKRNGWPQVGTKKHPVHLVATFHLPAGNAPDLLSLEEALSDLLQKGGVLANDYWIESWDGSRRTRDPHSPRTEVAVYLYEPGAAVQRELL